MNVVGFDSKVIRRNPSFKALLGIGITVDNYSAFAREYDEVIAEIFNEHGMPKHKQVYKSSELLSLFYSLDVDIIPAVVRKLLPHIKFVDVFYSYFMPSWKDQEGNSGPEKIGIYPKQRLRHVVPVEFIDLIDGAYPAICCYSYIKLQRSQSECSYFLDGVSSMRPSFAVSDVIKNKSTKFLYRGDQVNYVISAADLCCRFIEELTLKRKVRLNKNMIKFLGLDVKKFKTTFIGEKWLRDIRPVKDVIINCNHKYPHPVFYFFPDKGVFERDSKRIMENSLLYKSAMNKAAELGGMVKFFQPEDLEFIQENDFLVTHNESAKMKAEELRQLGCLAKHLSSESIKNII